MNPPAQSGLPLRRGDAGEAVRDLQRRLTAAGHQAPDEAGTFGEGTEQAVRAFQEARGLRVDGICGPQTWAMLVEAGYALGDRLLYLRTPMLRGDDVALLQAKLGVLGFDAGRVDGILGERTLAALTDFQQNAGLTVDGVCGPATLVALDRLGAKTVGPESVAGVREREALRRAPRTLEGRRIVVAEPGGLGALASAVTRVLTDAGAVVVELSGPDGSLQAAQANDFGADLFLGLAGTPTPGCVTAYYAAHGFVSAGGHHLAQLAWKDLAPLLGSDGTCRGMSLPVLRETRMPAVIVELGPVPAVVAAGADLARALGRAVGEWVRRPVEPESTASTTGCG